MVMSYTASMDISEIIRPEDLSKTDFFDFVTPTDMELDRPPGNDNNNTINQPLQGYDQFWGAEKDSNRLESAIFEDLNRYCWNQQSNNINGGVNPNQPANTDGQIYTLTVLNGSEQWLKREPNENANAPSLDLDTLLGNFPCYIKTEFPYDDSGFSTEHKEDIMTTNHTIVTNNISNTSLSSYPSNNNNNNDWHIPDHNNTEQDSPESLLRSALQGKGYAKGQLQLQLQNGITVLPPHSRDIKSDEELRRALFSTDQENLAFADSTLATPLFDDHTHTSCSPNPSTATTPSHIATGNVHINNGVDDMFLTLDTAFTDDFEKIKRIATEVQQFCVTSETYPQVTLSIKPPNELVTTSQPPVITTTISTTITSVPTTPTTIAKTTKKYKRANSNSSNSNNNNNNNNNSILNNNNNNTTTNNNNSNNNNNNSPSQCNGQRKERALHYCSICSKGFKDKYSVNVHIRTHTGEKPFACSLCGKSFRQKAHLAKHYQTHLAQKNPSGVVKGSKHHNNNNNNSSNNNNNNNNTNNNLNTTTNGGQTGPVITR